MTRNAYVCIVYFTSSIGVRHVHAQALHAYGNLRLTRATLPLRTTQHKHTTAAHSEGKLQVHRILTSRVTGFVLMHWWQSNCNETLMSRTPVLDTTAGHSMSCLLSILHPSIAVPRTHSLAISGLLNALSRHTDLMAHKQGPLSHSTHESPARN